MGGLTKGYFEGLFRGETEQQPIKETRVPEYNPQEAKILFEQKIKIRLSEFFDHDIKITIEHGYKGLIGEISSDDLIHILSTLKPEYVYYQVDRNGLSDGYTYLMIDLGDGLMVRSPDPNTFWNLPFIEEEILHTTEWSGSFVYKRKINNY